MTVTATYSSLFLCDVVCVWHEEPLHSRLGFDLLPPQTGDAGQHHGFPQDRFCSRRDFHTYWLAQVDWRSTKQSQAFSTAASLMETLSVKMFSSSQVVDITRMFGLHCADFDTRRLLSHTHTCWRVKVCLRSPQNLSVRWLSTRWFLTAHHVHITCLWPDLCVDMYGGDMKVL